MTTMREKRMVSWRLCSKCRIYFVFELTTVKKGVDL